MKNDKCLNWGLFGMNKIKMGYFEADLFCERNGRKMKLIL